MFYRTAGGPPAPLSVLVRPRMWVRSPAGRTLTSSVPRTPQGRPKPPKEHLAQKQQGPGDICDLSPCHGSGSCPLSLRLTHCVGAHDRPSGNLGRVASPMTHVFLERSPTRLRSHVLSRALSTSLGGRRLLGGGPYEAGVRFLFGRSGVPRCQDAPPPRCACSPFQEAMGQVQSVSSVVRHGGQERPFCTRRPRGRAPCRYRRPVRLSALLGSQRIAVWLPRCRELRG